MPTLPNLPGLPSFVHLPLPNLVSLEAFFIGGMLLTAFFSVGRKRLPTFLRHYALSSACLAGVIAANAVRTHHPAEWVGAALTVIVKVGLIPGGLLLTARRAGDTLRLKPITRPVLSYALASAAVLGAYLMARRLPVVVEPTATLGAGVIPLWGLVFVALALILLGFLILIIRRDLLSQIVGFLTLENGISAFAVVAIGGAPFLMEMGIFAVIASGVLLMALLSREVQGLYRSHDTAILRNLVD
jgi:hydrogenase-4 membrane subunit HyfE